MTSIVFVHGTGGREKAYGDTFKQIEEKLHQYCPNVSLFPCLWGDRLGAKLQAKGASIPDYHISRGESADTGDDEVHLWESLYNDPFYEMRLLGFRDLQGQRPILGQQTPAQELQNRITALPQDKNLQATLVALGIDDLFDTAYETVVGKNSKPFGLLLKTASQPLAVEYAAIAKAMVAQIRKLCEEQYVHLRFLNDANQRDKAVNTIEQALTQGETSRGVIFDWTKKHLAETVLSLGTNAVKRRRGSIMDGTYPFAGDILLYQAKGHKIREFIQQQLENEQVTPPVILMAHSLGGIACVDLLIEQNLSQKVQGLITVGSQAPFFYEIGALQQLNYGDPLPEHFPKNWLNIYDLRDFLSYVGDQPGLFPGKMKDVRVDNRQPFPEAHGAYWANEATWDAITDFLP